MGLGETINWIGDRREAEEGFKGREGRISRSRREWKDRGRDRRGVERKTWRG